MKVRLLKEEYLKSDNLFDDFCNNLIEGDIDHFSEDEYILPELRPFPFYLAYKDADQLEKSFMEAFKIIKEDYIKIDREITMSQQFWHSLLLVNFRDYVIEEHPAVTTNKNRFKNIVIKSFDWENYIYKCLLAVEYAVDNLPEVEHDLFYSAVINNLDLYNYLIKYTVTRNDKFIINVLKIVERNNLSTLMKSQIKDRPDLGKDERYGRRVIFEFNKDYPVVLSPMMDIDDMESLLLNHLSKYKS
jgi:hypothetical protein